MTYQETCQYLFNQMPMFEKQGSAGYKEGLTNTVLLDEHLGHPHQSYATIHIGSMTYFLELAIEEIVNAKNLILNLLAIVEKDMIHIKL